MISKERLSELWRYYSAGVINTLFGLGAYSALVWLGMNLFAAQLLAHLLGMAFNYLTYSRHVFRAHGTAKGRFIASYAVNYAVSLGTLAALSRFIASPYLAGILTTFFVSIANYFALKHLVFKTSH